MDETKSNDLYVPADYKESIFRKYKYGSKIKGVHTCAVPKCIALSENFANTSLHKFPKTVLSDIWAKRRNLSPSKSNLFICSDHFVDSDFHHGKADNYKRENKKRRLFAWAIPSKNLPEEDIDECWEVENLDENSDVGWPDEYPKEESIDFQANPSALQHGAKCVMRDNSTQTEYISHDKSVQVNTIHDFMPKFSILDIMTSDDVLNSWTAIPTFRLLHAIEDCIIVAFPDILRRHKLTLVERIVLCFIKLKTNMTFVCMASLFGVDDGSVSRNFATTLALLAQTLRPVVYFPSTDEIAANMPKAFVKYKFTSTRAILDCSEVKIQLPKCINCRIASYSQYKKGHTIKFLISITPAGLISHISEAYSGKSSDKFIFNSEDLVESFDSFTDAIMVDKGVLIENELLERGLQIVRPSFFRSNINQFPEEEVVCNTQIARLRVHVERAIQRMKVFSVLTDQIEYNILPLVNDMLTVTAAIANLSKPILAEERF